MIRWRALIIGATGGALAILALPLTGLLDPASGNGQWAPIEWYQQVAARQSIALRSATITVPPLDDPERIRRGAGHFELVCANCHGSPAAPPERFATDILPEPPRLTAWRPPQRLFFTVKHGIRHSAMPAWPTALRDDEVWDMVAFLGALPTLDGEAYAALVHGGEPPGGCTACHSADGVGNAAFPRLDIQSEGYLVDALRAFRDGSRASGTMMAVARGLSDEEIVAFAAEFGRSVRVEPPTTTAPGQQIAQLGIPDRDIPACDSCHGAAARPDFPRLHGQSVDYLRTQLELFQSLGRERGGRFADIMAEVVEDHLEEGPHRLSDEEREAVIAWYGR